MIGFLLGVVVFMVIALIFAMVVSSTSRAPKTATPPAVAPTNASGQPAATNTASTTPATPPAKKFSFAGLLGGLVVIVALVGLVFLGLRLLGGEHHKSQARRSKVVSESGFEHSQTFELDDGAWKKAEDIDWTKVQSGFRTPTKKGKMRFQAVDASTEWKYALCPPNGKVVEVTPENEESVIVTAPKGSFIKAAVLEGAPLRLYVQWND